MNALLKSDQKLMTETLEQARVFIDRDYLQNLPKSSHVENPSTTNVSTIRMVKLQKIVYNEEDVQSKLLSLFNTLHDIVDSCFLLIVGHKENVEVYLGIRSEESSSTAIAALEHSLDGNFPGTTYSSINENEIRLALSSICKNGTINNTSVVSLTQIPSIRDNDENNKNGTQNIEHFINAMIGQNYVAIVMANPINSSNVSSLRNNLENLYSSLSALNELSYQYSDTITRSEQYSLTTSITQSITNSISSGYTYSTTQSSGTNQSSSPHIHTQINSLGLGYGIQTGSFQSSSYQQGASIQQGQAQQSGQQAGKGITKGSSKGSSKGITIKQVNKTVAELLYRIDEQIKRLRDGETYGIWESCAFFVSSAPDVALVAANVYKSLCCGSKTGNEKSYINRWDSSNQQKAKEVANILRSLENIKTPSFHYNDSIAYTPSSIISGKEIPMMINFPLHSVNGLTVVQMAAFGRDVYNISENSNAKRELVIGRIQHMGHAENTPVKLDIDSLSAHVLVSGTTGVGKSTLMTMILSALHDINIKMLIVEPVKGEYKQLLGKLPGIQVYSTDPRKNRMLRINPFQFRDGVHVLTHIDRLIEVFSVCWPLYAAQPAMLRECIEEAYVRVGWDLCNSIFVKEPPIKFPDFRVLLDVIPDIIKKSKFVGESKGTYEGALLTRVSMLTNGIFGQVFNGNTNLDDLALFENNTVIDLSDVGSQETISLIMGILVVRLREYRSSTDKPLNQPLKHVMVLEEAHNIFQRNTQANVEGGETISGKSVQMLSQCIAEMRGYGQGIFIVDQSPGEIDISGIRNTATKIIMRLPEASDKKAIADSLALTDLQVNELSRLPRQVAIIYQTGWVEPVLVKINNSKRKYFNEKAETISYADVKKIRGFLISILLSEIKNMTYDSVRLCNAIKQIKGVYEGKKQDYIDLFNAFDNEYKCIVNLFFKASIRMPFYSRLICEVLAVNDFCRLCPLPIPQSNAKKPYSEDIGFRKQCMAWKTKALSVLDNYVFGLKNEDKEIVLQYILVNAKNPREITVHNAIYGKIK